MYTKIKFLLFTTFFYLISSIFCSTVQAEGDFIVNYTVDYAISEEGKTNVVQNIALVNKHTNLYAREYSIRIDSTKIKNISAFDKKGSITPSISLQNNKTEIRLAFNDQVVGQGKTLFFQLKYEDENIAKKNGSIWEVTIPGVAPDSDLGEYTVHLHVPRSFGPAAYIFPEPDQIYKWSKDALINGGVSAAFGKEQVFDVTLSYFLENTKTTPILTEIALPPSTGYQFITIDSLEPKPETVIPDADGNWLARYKLEGQSNIIVQAKIIVQIFLTQRNEYTNVPPNDSYLSPSKYWQTTDPAIVAQAQRLKTPKNIYDFVVTTLEYDYEKINKKEERKGAVATLSDPDSSVCMEFTDLFVALARSAGIPARQAVGYAYTTNPKLRPLSLVSDVLHAWPEYYDHEKKMWIPVDPTWENTTGGIDYFNKLDFNHIVFAYNGNQDDYPYPAGFYRQAGRVGKDVDVRFREDSLPIKVSTLNTNFDFPSRIFSGFATSGHVLVRNSGNIGVENTTTQIVSTDFGISTKTVQPIIPPYGVVSIPFSIQNDQLFGGGQKVITALVNDSTKNHSVTVTPFYYVLFFVLIIIVWVVLIVAIVVRKKIHPKK